MHAAIPCWLTCRIHFFLPVNEGDGDYPYHNECDCKYGHCQSSSYNYSERSLYQPKTSSDILESNHHLYLQLYLQLHYFLHLHVLYVALHLLHGEKAVLKVSVGPWQFSVQNCQMAKHFLKWLAVLANPK